MTAKTRVTLADDHPIVLAGLRNLIQSEGDLDLVGEATSGLSALRLIRETRPDVAVIDISMPELNGILLSRRLAEECPSVRIMVLTLHEDRAYLKQALDAGVRGYVLKRSAAENLIHGIRAVLCGGLYVDPAIANRMFDDAPLRGRSVKGAMPELTGREAEVLKLAAHGLANKEIARRLDIGAKSVETYKARATEKLGLKTRAEIVRYASAQGWLADI
jgi:DNA-binding NarL/FixJ family response regulator